MEEKGEGEREVQSVESGTMALLQTAEVNQQIATAKAYPRAIVQFRKEALQLATLNLQMAQDCIYSLPRKDAEGQLKNIRGPSARFAEIMAYSWGNCRAGARVVNEGPEFVTAQGAFHDLERNVAITYEVQRRITNKHGRRYSADMVGVTANAACSIALRNAILKGIPKALWLEMFKAAESTVRGDIKTLEQRRTLAFEQFAEFKVTKEMLCEVLEVEGVQDIGLDDLVTLGGILTALKEGDTTVDQTFGKAAPGKGGGLKTPQAQQQPEGQAGGAQQQPEGGQPQGGQQPPAAQGGDPGPAGDLLGGDKPPPPGAHKGKTISGGVVKTLRSQLKVRKKTEEELCHNFDIAKLEDLPADKVDAATAWLSQ